MVNKSLPNQEIEIRVFMLRSGLTLRSIAHRLGITHPYVVQVLKGRRPALHVRRRLVEEIGFPADLILYRPQAPRSRAA